MQTFTQTKLRKDVLSILQHANSPMKAYDILACLRDTRPNAQPSTVYRVLDFLKSKHAIHEIAHQHTYVICQAKQQDNEHPIVILLVCGQCQGVDEVPANVMSEVLGLLTRSTQFQLTNPTIELLGLCQNCQ